MAQPIPAPRLASFIAIVAFFYVSQSLRRHSLTDRPRLSACFIFLLSSTFCYFSAYLTPVLPLPQSWASSLHKRTPSKQGSLLGPSDDDVPKEVELHLPHRPKQWHLPILVTAIVLRLEIFHQVTHLQQCATPGVESFLPVLLLVYEFATRKVDRVHENVYNLDDPWRHDLQNLYDRANGTWPHFLFTLASVAIFCTGTFLSLGMAKPSTFFCYDGVDHRSHVLLIQCVALGLDALILVLVWRIMAWTKSPERKVQTIGRIMALSSFAMVLLGAAIMLTTRSGFELSIGYAYGFDVVIDSVAFTALAVAISFWLADSMPATPPSIVTFSMGLYFSLTHLYRLGDWLHLAPLWAVLELYLVAYGSVFFIYVRGLYTIAFVRRSFYVLSVAFLLATGTFYTFTKSLPSFSRHPVSELTYLANSEQDRWRDLARTSETFRVAAGTYWDRHSNTIPPPKFEAWYNMAKDTEVVDQFPRIAKDLEPFRQFEPSVLRLMSERMAVQPGIASIVIKNQKASHKQVDDKRASETLDKMVGMINKFAEHLPDMVLPINLDPLPKVLPSWGGSKTRKRSSHSHATESPVSSDVPSIHTDTAEPITPRALKIPGQEQSLSAAGLRRLLTEACPSGSRIRRNTHWNMAEFCEACVSPYSHGQLLMNWTKFLEICDQPDMLYLHGYTLTPQESNPYTFLVPLFSAAKMDVYSDIVIPIPDISPIEPDLETSFLDREDAMYWRFEVDKEPTWQALHGGQKYRLLHLLKNPSPNDRVTMLVSFPGTTDNFWYENAPVSDANGALPFHVEIDGDSLQRCQGPNCDILRQTYPGSANKTNPLNYRYILTVDEDDGPPKNFLSVLRSRSAPLLSTIFRTWYTDRLIPWLHFIPVDPRYHALHSTFSYFTGTEDRGDVNGRQTQVKNRESDAEYIGLQGRKWALKVLDDRHMEVYLFRLLLEWGRLLDEKRDEIGIVLDDDDQLRDTGWTQRS